MKSIGIFLVFIFSYNMVSAQNMYKGSGKVLFVSEAPLEVIRAESNQLTGIVEKSSMNFAYRLNVSTFEGFNSALQKEHFNEHYLETQKYPDATLTGKLLLDEDCENNCVTSATCKGKFTIHGVTQIVSIPISFKIEDSYIYISGQFNILLSDYNIKIPRIVQAKISPEISVNVEVELKKQ